MKVSKKLYQGFYNLGYPVEGIPQELNMCKLFHRWKEMMRYPVDFPGMESLSNDSPDDWETFFAVVIPDNMFGTGIPAYVNEDDLLSVWYEEFTDYLRNEIPKFGFLLEKETSGILWFRGTEV